MPISIGDALLTLGVDSKDMDNALSTLGNKINSGLGNTLKGIGVGLATAGTAAIGFGVASAKSFADTGSEIYDMSKRTGMGAKALSEYKYMAEQTGASLGSVETAVKRMQVAINSGSEALGGLGINIDEISKLSPEKQFESITAAIAKIEDPTARAAAAVGIFGRSGTDLLGMLSEGTAGMDAMKQKAADMGIVFTDQTAAQADTLGDSLDDVQKAMEGVMNEIALALLPAIQPLIDAFLELVKALPLKEISELIKSLLPPLVELLLKVLEAIPVEKMISFVEKALIPLIDALTSLIPLLEPILDIFGSLLDVLSPVINAILQVVDAVVRLAAALANPILQTIGGIMGAVGSGVQGAIGNFKLPSFAGFEGVIPGTPGTPIPAVVHAGEYIGQGKGNTINIQQMVVREEADINRIARELYRMQTMRGAYG